MITRAQAIEAKDASERERLAYHHALVATLNQTIQRVGSVYDKGDSYVWLITFTPRLRDAVIVESFKSHTGDESTRVFWLADLKLTYGSEYGRLFGELFGKANMMQNIQHNALSLEQLVAMTTTEQRHRNLAAFLGLTNLPAKGNTMSKKDFIALADAIRLHNRMNSGTAVEFSADHLNVLANFCRSQNSNFMRNRWLEYIAGKCGKNGGAIKAL
jgi:hypothetical protein